MGRATTGALAGLALTVAAAAASPEAAVVVRGDLGRRLDEYMSRLEAVGYSGGLAVVKGGETVLLNGYGRRDRARGVPMGPDSVFNLGSITKPCTAAAVLRLQEAGKLKTTDPVSRFFAGVPEDKAGITLEHLLTHSSGLESDFSPTDYEATTREEYVRRALDSKLLFPPGQGYAYSNAGYSLLAAIVEMETGKDYETALGELVLKPAGLVETGYKAPRWDPSRVARGYEDGEDWGTILARIEDPAAPFWALRGNGGLHTTLADMVRWDAAGGYLILYLPHAEHYPNRGMPGANPDHKHDFVNGDITAAMLKVAKESGCGWHQEVDEVRTENFEYSFLQVYRKREDGITCGYTPQPKPARMSLGIVRLGAFGDALWITTILPALKAQGWDEIVLYTQRQGETSLRHEPNIDRMIVQPDGIFGEGDLAAQSQTAYWLWCERKHDQFINLVGSVESTLLPHPSERNFWFPAEQRRRLMSKNYFEQIAEWAGVEFNPKTVRVKFTPTRRTGEGARDARDVAGAAGDDQPERVEPAAIFDAEVSRHLSADDLQGVIHSDGELEPGEMTLETAELLRSAGPWGQHFPEPMFEGDFDVVSHRVVGGRHLKLSLRYGSNGQAVEAMAFNQADNTDLGGAHIRVAYRLDANEFRGVRNLQLVVDYLERL